MNRKILAGILASVFVLGTGTEIIALTAEGTNNLMKINSEVVRSGQCGENVNYVLTADGTLAISGTGPMDDYVLSSDVPWYYSKGGITEVIISSGVTTIGNYAFYICRALASVTMSDSLESIGNNAFRGCESLSSVEIPNSVTRIGDHAFHTSALTNVTLPDSVVSIGSGAFYNCSKLYAVSIPNSVVTIGSGAFQQSGLRSVIIPDSVTDLGGVAFQGCVKLQSVTLSKSLTTIEKGTFTNCGFNEIIIPDSVTSIGNGAFDYCSKLTTISIPASVISLGPFFKIDALTTVNYGGTESDKAVLKNDYGMMTNVFEDATWVYNYSHPSWAPTSPIYANWAESHVFAATEKGLIVASLGMDYTKPITREQIADILVNMVEKYTGMSLISADTSTFSDTTETAVLKANEAGIISGMGDGTFAPNSTATREQIAMMIYKTILVMEEATGNEIVTKNTTLGQYTDSSEVSGWAKDAVAILANNGIMEGTGDGNLSPLSTASIEQGIVLNNALFELN